MVRAVHQRRAQVDHGIARQHALGQILAQALFNRRYEVARYSAADDLIHEFELAITVEDRLELYPYVAELAVTAGLLLVTALNLDGLADGLAIRDLGILKHGLCAELGLQLLIGDFQMQFAHTGKQRLGGKLALCDAQRGILDSQAGQTREYLVFAAGLLGVYRQRDARLRELDHRVADGLGRVAQRVAGVGELQLGQRTDVTRSQRGNGGLLLAAQYVNSTGLFGLFRIGVIQRGVGLQLARQHLEHG